MPFVGQGMLMFLRQLAPGVSTKAPRLHTFHVLLQRHSAHDRRKVLMDRNCRPRVRVSRCITRLGFGRKPVGYRCLKRSAIYRIGAMRIRIYHGEHPYESQCISESS